MAQREWDSDKGLVELRSQAEQLTRWQSDELTEADTRCKIIDVLFKQVLGWNEGAIRREERLVGEDRHGYVDYTFASDRNAFLVEAKRAGAYFEMPTGRRMKARSGGVLKQSRELSGAIQQVRSYCMAKAIPVGVVSNGVQIAVVAVHTSPQMYDVVLFDGLDALEKHFLSLWNILSPTSNARVSLEDKLATPAGREPPQFSRRLLDDIARRDESISRNPVDGYLRPHIQRYFSDMT